MESVDTPKPSDWIRERNSTRNVLLGIGALALGSYVLLAATSRALSPHEYSLFAAYWSVVMGLILGATNPLETFGLGSTHVNKNELTIDRQFVDAFKLVLVVALIAILVLLPWTVPRVFDGHWSFLIATVLTLIGFLLTYSSRGILIVEHRSARYAQLMSAESLLRILFAIALISMIGAGGSSASLAVSLAALLVGLASYYSVRSHISLKVNWKNASVKNTQTFRPLLVASLATLLLLNLGPFVVQFLAGAEAAAAGIFLNALTLSRVPIMLGPVLQARLVPSVSAILSREEFPTLRKLIGKGLRGLIIGGAIFVTGFAMFGDTVIDILFGGNTTLDHLDLALLAIPTFLYLLAIAFQSVLVALKETKKIAKAWVIGLMAYLLALLLPSEAILKVEVAGVVAMSTVVILLFSQLSSAMKSGLASNTIKT
jgi:O-antigen/teichoic acid export membrane protein